MITKILEQNKLCKKCKGSGSVYPKYYFDQRDIAFLRKKCKKCNGTGQRNEKA